MFFISITRPKTIMPAFQTSYSFVSVDKIPKCDDSNESSLVDVVFCSIDPSSVFCQMNLGSCIYCEFSC